VQWGLERTRRILSGVGNPLSRIPVLHVGGTNGKGSVARIWASILKASGVRVGLYSSPHLISFRERFLVGGRPVPDHRLRELAVQLRPFFIQEEPSYFEATTALAFLAFERARVDVAVIEVGLGGRLDATNVVSPVLTAITNVALEHRELLGDSLTEIAWEKAGILKPGVPAFTASRNEEVLQLLGREAATLGVPLSRISPPEGEVSLHGSRFRLRTRRWGDLDLTSPLIGTHQLENLALAVRSLEALPPRFSLPVDAVRVGVANARVPGRFQVERDGDRTWILDVAHNPPAARALASTLRRVSPPAPRVGVLGILADKDHMEILRALAPELDRIILTVPPRIPESRRWDPESARAELLSEIDVAVEVEATSEEAFRKAREGAGDAGTVLVSGSFGMVGEALRFLDRIPLEALPPFSEFG
jgi:dihydrofolate synthase / folylpolyglutamate synthase